MKLLRIAAAGFLGLTIAAAPAQACGEWLACLFGRAPHAVEPAAFASPPLPIELVVRASPRLPVAEVEVRRAFDIAYGKQRFDNDANRECAYRSWKDTIVPRPEVHGYLNYEYEPDEDHRISATLALASGRMEFDIRSTNAVFAFNLGRSLGLERDSGAGLFARAFVALGGTANVKNLMASWNRSSGNFSTFERLKKSAHSDWAAADATFTGKMASRFYGFRAALVSDDPMFAKTVLFQPPVLGLDGESTDHEVRPLLDAEGDDELPSDDSLLDAMFRRDAGPAPRYEIPAHELQESSRSRSGDEALRLR